MFEIGCQIRLLIAGQVHVTRQTQRQQANIGVALNIGVTAQRIDPAARHANVAQQQLDHAGTANHLHATGVMRPTQCVEERRRAVGHAGFADDAADFQKVFFGRAANIGHYLRRVATHMLFEQVPDTTRMAVGFVALGVAILVKFVHPLGAFVLLLLRIKAAEQTFIKTVTVTHNQRRIGVSAHVFMLDLIVGNQVVDHAHQKGNVRSGPNRRVDISDGRTAIKPRVNHNHFGAIADLGFDDPLETNRVCLGGVAAHNQHHVGVLDIDPVVGHCATAQRWRQRRNRWRMAQACLAIDAQHAECSREALVQKSGFVTRRRRTQHACGQPSVDGHACGIFFNEVGVAIILHQPCDTGDGLVPTDARPFVGAWRTVFRVFEALLTVNKINQPGALGAQRATADRVIRVAFNMENARLGVFCPITQAVHQNAATHRAIGAVIAGFFGTQQFVLTRRICLSKSGGKTECRYGSGRNSGRTKFDELSSSDVHTSPHYPCAMQGYRVAPASR